MTYHLGSVNVGYLLLQALLVSDSLNMCVAAMLNPDACAINEPAHQWLLLVKMVMAAARLVLLDREG